MYDFYFLWNCDAEQIMYLLFSNLLVSYAIRMNPIRKSSGPHPTHLNYFSLITVTWLEFKSVVCLWVHSCCGAGVAADAEVTTQMMSSNVELHSLNTGRPPMVAMVTRQLKQMLFRWDIDNVNCHYWKLRWWFTLYGENFLDEQRTK